MLRALRGSQLPGPNYQRPCRAGRPRWPAWRPRGLIVWPAPSIHAQRRSLSFSLSCRQVASMARTDCALAELSLMDDRAQAALQQLSESRGHLLSAVHLRLVRRSCRRGAASSTCGCSRLATHCWAAVPHGAFNRRRRGRDACTLPGPLLPCLSIPRCCFLCRRPWIEQWMCWQPSPSWPAALLPLMASQQAAAQQRARRLGRLPLSCSGLMPASCGVPQVRFLPGARQAVSLELWIGTLRQLVTWHRGTCMAR